MGGEDYNPFHLPQRLDFHQATRDLPLPRATRSRLQIYLSQKQKHEIRELLSDADEEINGLLKEADVPYVKGHILLPTGVPLREHHKRELVQKAILLKAMKDFADFYLRSLEMQRKI